MITIVEVPLFARKADGAMTIDELTEFKDFIARNPEAGDMIRGTGGLRKIRWKSHGSGKSGGARIIYYFQTDDIPLFLIPVYRKADRGRLTKAERNELRGLGKQLVDLYGK